MAQCVLKVVAFKHIRTFQPMFFAVFLHFLSVH